MDQIQHVIPTIHPAALLRGERPISDAIVSDLKKANRISIQGPTNVENYVIVHPTNPSGLTAAVREGIAWLRRWRVNRIPTAVDVEASSLRYWRTKLYSTACAGIDPQYWTGVAWTLRDFQTLPWEAEQAMNAEFALLLADANVTKIFHNGPYDIPVLRRKGFEIAGTCEDTLGLHHATQPDAPHDLGWVGHQYSDDVDPWKEDHELGIKLAFTRDPIKLLIYNCKDALNTAKIRNPLIREVLERGMNWTLIHYQSEFVWLAVQMELAGLPINWHLWREVGRRLRQESEWLKYQMRCWLGWGDFNPNSQHHLLEVLYGKKYAQDPWRLGLKPELYTEGSKKGGRSLVPQVGYDALVGYLEHPFIAKLVEYTEKASAWSNRYKTAEDVANGKRPRFKDNSPYAKAIEEDGRLHAAWKPQEKMTGSRFATSPNCYDAQTEVLTEHGWMFWPVANFIQPRLLQYDAGSKEACSVTASFISREVPVGSRVIRISNKIVNLRVTEDHRILFERLRQQNFRAIRTTETLPAKEFLNHEHYRSRLLQRAESYVTGTVQIPWEKIALLCACQADGWRRKYGKHEAWAWYLTRPRKITRLRKVLKILDPEQKQWREYPQPIKKSPSMVAFYLVDGNLKAWVDELLGPNKAFGPWLLTWTTESLQQFYSETGQWDGRSSNGADYSSCIKSNVDWAQIAAILSGQRVGNIREFWGSQSKKPCYQVTQGRATGRAGFHPEDVNIEILKEPEQFYCATVPSGYIFVRRNGIVAISGNCQNVPEWERIIFEAPEGRCFVYSDKDQLELRVITGLSGNEPMLKVLAEPGGDPHTWCCQQIYGAGFTALSSEDRVRTRTGTKTVEYASLYRARPEVVYNTIRTNKHIPLEVRRKLDRDSVRFIYNSLFNAMTGPFAPFAAYHDRNYAFAQQYKYLQIPPLGRVRCFPQINTPYTECSNWPVQCVHASTRIYTESGLLPIIDSNSTPADTTNGEVAPAILLPRGTAALLEVRTGSNEAPLLCSPDHEFLCQTADEYVYKKPGALFSGSLICTPLPEETLPSSLQNRDWPYWLGAMVSDACTRSYDDRLYFGTSKRNRPEDLSTQFYRFAEARGWNPEHPRADKLNLESVKMHDAVGRAAFLQDLNSWGYPINTTAHTKRVPESVFRAGRWGAIQFLWGILEADCGQVQNKARRGRTSCNDTYSLNMCNKELLQDILLLARYCGISCQLLGPYTADKEGHIAYRINFHGFDIEHIIFADRLHTRRRRRCAKEALAPLELCENFIKEVAASEFPLRSSAATLHHRLRTGGSVTPWMLRELYRIAGAKPPVIYTTLPVYSVRITDRIEPVYTLNVQHPLHRYVAQGLVSKNCTGSDIVGIELVAIQHDLLAKFHGTASVVLHGHDSVAIECFTRDAEAVGKIVQQHFGRSKLDGPRGPVYLTSKVKVGKNLLDLEPLKLAA